MEDTTKKKTPRKVKTPVERSNATSCVLAAVKSPDQLIKDDFRNFLAIVWEHLRLPAPTPVQYDIARYLQYGPKRCVIEAFRGVGKSFVTSAFVLWQLHRNPQLKILVVSASKERSDQFVRFTRSLIDEMPMLQYLKPDKSRGQRDSVVSFDVSLASPDQSPSVKAVGITGQITGSRADIIIADDVEVMNNSLTQMMRDQLAERIKEFESVLKPLDDARIIGLGTPQTEMSIYNLLPDRGYETRIWTARIPDNVEVYGDRLAPFVMKMIEGGAKAGDLVDPRRFDDENLRQRELSLGRSTFALQFMLNTSLSDAERFPLKLSDLIVHPLDPRSVPTKWTWASGKDQVIDHLACVGLTGDRYHRPMMYSREMIDYTGCVMSVDPSGRGNDETAYAVVKIALGNLYLVASGGFTDGYSDATMTSLAQIAKRHGVNDVIVESNFSDGLFTNHLKSFLTRIHPCHVEEVRHSTQKERRICDTLEPIFNSHRLIVCESVITNDLKSCCDEPSRQLMYQISRITRDRGSLAHDDRIDALSIAVSFWAEQMARNRDKAAQDHSAGLLEKELREFARNNGLRLFGDRGRTAMSGSKGKSLLTRR